MDWALELIRRKGTAVVMVLSDCPLATVENKIINDSRTMFLLIIICRF